jgi:hypothetical protein
MTLSSISLLILTALHPGNPTTIPTGSYQRGLFCDRIELVASIVGIADKGGDPRKAVSDINRDLDRRACFYTIDVDVLANVVKFERSIAAQNTTFGIYRVSVSGIGHQKTEIGELVWKFSAPLVMYTLREAPAGSAQSKHSAPGT